MSDAVDALRTLRCALQHAYHEPADVNAHDFFAFAVTVQRILRTLAPVRTYLNHHDADMEKFRAFRLAEIVGPRDELGGRS